MDLRAYLTTLRRNWLLLAVPVVIGVIAAVLVLGAQTPKYQSTAKVIVSVGNTANANDLSQANSFAQSAAANFAALAEQPYVLHSVRQQLKLTLSSDQIAKEMTTSVEQGTSIIAIDVLDSNAARAASIANTTATQLSTAVSVLNPAASDGTQTVRVTVVRTAGVAPDPIVPNRPLGLALGLLGGLLLGVVLIILRELLDTRVRTVTELQQLTGAPVVGQIPRTSSIQDRPLVMVEDRGGAAAEGFRLLQLNTEYLRAPDGVVVIGIASAVPSEGKSTVAANLALALAAAGHRVALVDADLRRPRLHDLFGIDNGLGLTEVLIGRADVLDVVQPWGPETNRIAIVPSGTVPPNPGELLQSPRLQAALQRLAEEADVVVVDGPPLLAVADSAVLARTVDAVLLVASLQRGHRGPTGRAIGVLESVGARVLGTVATMTRPARADSDAYLRYTASSTATAATASEREAEAEEDEQSAAEAPAPVKRRLFGRRPAPSGQDDAESAPVAEPDREDVLEEAATDDEPAAQPASGVVEKPSRPAIPVEDAVRVDPAGIARPGAPERSASVLPPTQERAEFGWTPTVQQPEPEPEPEPEPQFQPEPEPEPEREQEQDAESMTAQVSELSQPAGERDGKRAARGRAVTPMRVPSAHEVDARTMKALRKRMSAEDLRILRSFPTRQGQEGA